MTQLQLPKEVSPLLQSDSSQVPLWSFDTRRQGSVNKVKMSGDGKAG